MNIFDYTDDDFEDEEENTPSEEYFEFTVGYITTFKVKAKSQKEADEIIWKNHWKWSEDLLDPAIIQCEEIDYPDNPEEYTPIEDFYKTYCTDK